MNFAFIDPGLRKARFYLLLRTHLPQHRCFYYSRRGVVRAWIESAGCVAYPRVEDRPPAFTVTDDELRAAVGRKELTLRGKKALKRARALLGEISGFLDECNANVLVVWNGSNLRLSLAIYLARRRGLRVVYMEHGYLPGTMQMDLMGVNQSSSLACAVLRGEAKLPPNRKLDSALDAAIASFKSGDKRPSTDRSPPEQLQSSLLRRLSEFYALKLRDWYVERVWREGHALGLDRADELPPRFVLVPLQVQKDSQLILHSPLLGNDLARLLQWVRAAVQKVDAKLQVVVKFHPREEAFVQRRNLKLIREFPEMSFVSKACMRDLLARATAVVTINSTAGFEAFLYDKPVVALGRNFYTAPHLVETVTAAQDLSAALARALEKPVPVEQRRAFLRFVFSNFLVQGMYDDYSERSLAAVAERLQELLQSARAATRLEAHSEASDRSADRIVDAEEAGLGSISAG